MAEVKKPPMQQDSPPGVTKGTGLHTGTNAGRCTNIPGFGIPRGDSNLEAREDEPGGGKRRTCFGLFVDGFPTTVCYSQCCSRDQPPITMAYCGYEQLICEAPNSSYVDAHNL